MSYKNGGKMRDGTEDLLCGERWMLLMLQQIFRYLLKKNFATLYWELTRHKFTSYLDDAAFVVDESDSVAQSPTEE
uniref:Uncharacterized protein n=1 Tax=Magallana gigas TaxID=29159 RepID=A0A8W8JDM5_MAGGI